MSRKERDLKDLYGVYEGEKKLLPVEIKNTYATRRKRFSETRITLIILKQPRITNAQHVYVFN